MKRVVQLVLFWYPRQFRRDYETQIIEFLDAGFRDETRERGRLAGIRFFLKNLFDLSIGAVSEWRDERHRKKRFPPRRRDGIMLALLQDIRYAVRMIQRRPGFAVAVLVTLTLGIGTSTTVLSVADTLLIRELPYPDAEEIVTIWRNNRREGVPREDVAPGNFLDWRERNEVFEWIAAADPYSMDLTSDGPPEALYGVKVTENFFDVLGVQPLAGRLFRPEDHTFGRDNVVVLSHGLWQRRFGLAPDVVGRTLTLDGEPRVVIGILPPEFELGLLPAAGERGLWAPRVNEGWEQNVRSSGWWNVVGRLKPNVSVDQAQADMDRLTSSLAQEYPTSNVDIGATIVPFRDHLVGSARPALYVLLGAVALVLLIACANVANLLLARGTDRESEFVLRAALGAESGRLVRQLFVESMVYAVLGAGLGFAFAFWGVSLIKGITPGDIPRLDDVAVDMRVFVSALGIGVGAALLFGLAPATQFANPHVREALSERRSAGRAKQRLRATLIVTEVALAMMLLVGAGLLLRSFANIVNVDPGFSKDRLVALQVFAIDDDGTANDRIAFFAETLERIDALPMVEMAGAVSAAPFLEADLATRRPFAIEGTPPPAPGEEPQTYIVSATEGYFPTIGVPLISGRIFTEFDRAGSAPVAIINETMSRQFWPNTPAVGERVTINESSPIEIVGVVGDVRHRGLDDDPRPELFLAHRQTGASAMTYFVRATGSAAAAIDAVQQSVWAVEPLQAFYRTATMDELMSNTLKPRRFIMALLSVFAGLALLLAGVGVYGIISFYVSSRTHEMGVRMALGATKPRLLQSVVMRGLALTTAGLVAGLIGAWSVTRALSGFLYDVTPLDPFAFVGAMVAIFLVSAVASYLPARRASQVDPAIALKYE